MFHPGLQPTPQPKCKCIADTCTISSLLTTPNSFTDAGDHVPPWGNPLLLKFTLNLLWLGPAVTLSYSPKALANPANHHKELKALFMCLSRLRTNLAFSIEYLPMWESQDADLPLRVLLTNWCSWAQGSVLCCPALIISASVK